MPDKCSARNVDGSPCGAKPYRDGLCRWHHPSLAEERRQNAIAGGRARSNQARARKALAGGSLDLQTTKAVLMQSLAKVYKGEMEPATATALAALARAIVHVSGASELESRIAELEAVAQGRSA